MPRAPGPAALLVVWLLGAAAAVAEVKSEGILRVPENASGPLPAVVFVTSSPGFDGRGAFHSEALNASGFATLELDVTVGKGLPANPIEHLPRVFAALGTLASDPRIDPDRIGLMGVSYGGTLALLASSEALAPRERGRRFAAHLALYPVCWRHHAIAMGRTPWPRMERWLYRKVTERPVHILVGDRDGYDKPGDCGRFVAALDERVRPFFSVTAYPNATFAWDARFSSVSYEANANHGTGGMVTTVADADIAEQSRQFALAFFLRSLR
jgi:dienelactone hydrolase